MKMGLKNIKKQNWTKIITRPFTLFGASIWNEWYTSQKTKEIFGFILLDSLFIEHPKGMVRHYRDKNKLGELKKFVKGEIAQNPIKYETLLKQGTSLNKKAKTILKSKPFTSVEDAVNFLTELALLSTILPYVVGESTDKKKFFRKLSLFSMMLRGASLYPKIIKEVIEPLVEKELAKLGMKEKGASHLITYQELLKKDLSNINKRLSESRRGKTFIYQRLGNKEYLFWVSNPDNIIKEIESEQIYSNGLRGSIAFKGKVKGKVRIILTNDLRKVKFEKGDILVATSTNPTLVPIIKKASAIVTDEGGIMSHAAIISRELKIPCIVGTGNATKVLKDGDFVEVNANHGVVKILKKANP